MKKRIYLKNFLFVASLAFASLLSVSASLVFNSKDVKEAEAAYVKVTTPQDYLYFRLTNDINRKLNNKSIDECYLEYTTGYTHTRQYKTTIDSFVNSDDGNYEWGRIKAPSNITVDWEYRVDSIGPSSTGGSGQRSSEYKQHEGLDTLVLDGTAWSSGTWYYGYWTKIIFMDMNDCPWISTYGYGQITAIFNNKPSDVLNVVQCDDVINNTGKKICFIEIPKDGNEQSMSSIPTSVTFKAGDGSTNELVTTVNLERNSNYLYKISDQFDTDGHPITNTISLDNRSVTFQNDDGTILQQTEMPYAEMATYSGETPSKTYTSSTYYDFKGWDTTPTYVTQDIVYTATYNETPISPSSFGWLGGETYFFVDKQNNFSDCLLRIRFWDDLDHDFLSVDYRTDYVYKTSGSYYTYRVIIPEYDGDSLYGWTKMIVCRYNPEYASDETVNWDHVWTKSDDLKSSDYKSKTEWWADGYKWWLSGNINMSAANNADLNGYSSGITRYFDMANWDQSGRTGYMALYFMGAIGDGNSAFNSWVLLNKKVLGTGSDYAGGLWEYTVPYANDNGSDKLVTWHSYIVVELKEGATEANWDNKLYQSGDINFTNQYNIIKGGANQSECTMDYDLADITRLTYFVNYFKTLLDGVCDADGRTNLSSLNTAWSNASNQFPLEHRIQAMYTETDPNQLGNVIEKSAARYDYILYKYNGNLTAGDFASRVSGGHFAYGSLSIDKNFNPFLLGDNSINTMLIIVASSVSLLSITALSILLVKKRKRKEQ